MERIKRNDTGAEALRVELLGSKSELAERIKQIGRIPKEERHRIGPVVSEVKRAIEEALAELDPGMEPEVVTSTVDVTMPGIKPPEGHLHIVTQAIMEITDIFEKIGFTRVRHPQVDWDYYPFESLNMPPTHAGLS